MTARLLIDAGNTRLKWRLDAEDGPRVAGCLVHRDRPLAEALAELPDALARPSAIWCGSVAGSHFDAALDAALRARWSLSPTFVQATAAAGGIVSAYAEPARMGVDRWLAMIGARARTRRACCVIDAGTAVTVDALAADGRHLGGTILPGLQLMRTALYGNTRRIPAGPVLATPSGLGRDTAACVAAGVRHAVVGGITGSVQSAGAGAGEGLHCLLTGGDGAFLAPLLPFAVELVPDLVLDGLARLAGSAGA